MLMTSNIVCIRNIFIAIFLIGYSLFFLCGTAESTIPLCKAQNTYYIHDIRTEASGIGTEGNLMAGVLTLGGGIRGWDERADGDGFNTEEIEAYFAPGIGICGYIDISTLFSSKGYTSLRIKMPLIYPLVIIGIETAPNSMKTERITFGINFPFKVDF